MISYANGQWLNSHELSIPLIQDLAGSVRGLRIFTAARTTNQLIFRQGDHLDRLFQSAKAVYLPIQQTPQFIEQVVQEFLKKNKDEPDFLVEIFISGGPVSSDGVTPSGESGLYVLALPLKLPSTELIQKGYSLASFKHQRQFAKAKLTFYVGAIAAHHEAVLKHKADLPLFISPDNPNEVLEGSTFNIFCVKNNALWTPPLDGRIIEGITRKTILELASELKIEVKENNLVLDDLWTADECFISSTTRNVMPVNCIDSKPIQRVNGPITVRLQNAFQELLSNYKA